MAPIPESQRQLVQLFKHLDSETISLEQEVDRQNSSNVFIASLQLDKLSVNMSSARSILVRLEKDPSSTHSSSHTQQYRQHLKRLNDRVQHLQMAVRTIQEREFAEYKLEQAKQDNQESELRNRAAPEKEPKPVAKQQHELTMDEKLAVQDNMQEQYADGILNMVSTIKQNAQRFNDQVTKDKDVLGNAADSLEKTSTSMGAVGSKLNSYQSTTALGWKFYIIAAVGIVLALIFGMIIIQLFPKW